MIIDRQTTTTRVVSIRGLEEDLINWVFVFSRAREMVEEKIRLRKKE